MICYGLWACCFLAFVASFDCCIGLGDLVGFGGCDCCVCLDWFGLWVGVAWVLVVVRLLWLRERVGLFVM